METLVLKGHPELLKVIRAVDPVYRKPKVFLSVVEAVTLTGTYWSGGSRSTYTAVSLETGLVATAAQFNPPQFGGPATDPRVSVPVGVVIVETGLFCGKKATAHVYVNPANMAKLLQSVT